MFNNSNEREKERGRRREREGDGDGDAEGDGERDLSSIPDVLYKRQLPLYEPTSALFTNRKKKNTSS